MLGKENCKDIIDVFLEHRPIMNLVYQLANSIYGRELEVENTVEKLKTMIETHYEKEELDVFPRILKHHIRRGHI